MTNILKQNADLKILTEFWPMGLRRFGCSPEKFLNKLMKMGFGLHYINEERCRLEPVDVTKALEICKGEKHINILCTKKI
jgi:hypothetical protein